MAKKKILTIGFSLASEETEFCELCNRQKLKKMMALLVIGILLSAIYPLCVSALEPNFALDHLAETYTGSFRWNWVLSNDNLISIWLMSIPLVSLIGLFYRINSRSHQWVIRGCIFYIGIALGVMLWHFFTPAKGGPVAFAAVDNLLSLIFACYILFSVIALYSRISPNQSENPRRHIPSKVFNFLLLGLFLFFVYSSIPGKKVITIHITASSLTQENIINAVGYGKYILPYGGEKKIKIRIKILPETQRFEMWEIDPDESTDFETDGSHVGSISRDLKTIKAIWTTFKTGKQGRLYLEAK